LLPDGTARATGSRGDRTVLAEYPGQPWRQIVGRRNFAAHQYDDLDARRVWLTVTRDVPALRAYLVDVVRPGLDG